MNRKIAVVIAAAGLSVPVGAVVASNPAFAITHTQTVSGVAEQHKESMDASRDASKEGSKVDTSKDASKDGPRNDNSRDTTSIDTSASSGR